MITKENTDKKETRDIPIYKVRMMTDDEWNRLAYRNMLERRAGRNGREEKVFRL